MKFIIPTKEESDEKLLSRRSFFSFAGKVSLAAGVTAVTAGCDGNISGGTGWVPEQYNAKGTFPVQVRGRIPIDPNNVAICRDDKKCILCGQCVEVCEKVQTVMGNYNLPLIDSVPCIDCGQCTLWCPTGAITEVDDTDKVIRALLDPTLHVVVQTAPATRVALGEEFGMKPGEDIELLQVAALRKLGFDKVFDTNFSADLTIMEEATELLQRIQNNGVLPQFTSCSPGWVKFCEMFYPELIPNLSSAKSPMTMLGSMIKTYYAKEQDIDPSKIVSVAIMPCTAKKSEAARPEMNGASVLWEKPDLRDVDIVLTTRELARLIKSHNIDLTLLQPANYDRLMSEYSGAGAIFGVTGGVMEAAVRTSYYFITGERPPEPLFNLQPVRGLEGIKEAAVNIPSVGEIRVAVCSGMGNARPVLEAIQNGEKAWHFVEFMGCPGGCIAGGGQPRSALPPSDEIRALRMKALYSKDERATIRLSYENSEIQSIYKQFLGEPCGERAHQLLHTHYQDRSIHFNKKKA